MQQEIFNLLGSGTHVATNIGPILSSKQVILYLMLSAVILFLFTKVIIILLKKDIYVLKIVGKSKFYILSYALKYILKLQVYSVIISMSLLYLNFVKIFKYREFLVPQIYNMVRLFVAFELLLSFGIIIFISIKLMVKEVVSLK